MYELLKFYILPLLLCISFTTNAQQITWANKVIEKSTETKTHEAKTILKAPNAFKVDLAKGNMWVPNPSDTSPQIKLEFSEAINTKQILVFPNIPPDAFSSIVVYNEKGESSTLSSYDYNAYPDDGFGCIVLNSNFPPLKAVKFELTQGKKKELGIDAVGLADFSDKPTFSQTEYLPTSLNIVLSKLDHLVNSNSHEVQSFVNQKGDHIYFLRRNHPLNTGGVSDKGDIWESYKNPETGLWGNSARLSSPINTKGINILSGVSEMNGERSLLLGNHYGKLNSHEGFSIANNVDDEWQEPTPIKIQDYYNYAEHANFFMSFDQQILIMSIETDYSKGKSDLYVSFRTKKGWSKPKNLGREINSKENEITPFLLADNKTLFFASDGHKGLGRKDIYVSYRLDDKWGRWTKPKNLGKIINSELDESDFSISSDREQMLFTRSEEDKKGDLFEARLSSSLFHEKIPLALSDTVFYDSTQTVYYIYEQATTKETTIITPIISPDVHPEMPQEIELFHGHIFQKGNEKAMDMVLVNSEGVTGIHTSPKEGKVSPYAMPKDSPKNDSENIVNTNTQENNIESTEESLDASTEQVASSEHEDTEASETSLENNHAEAQKEVTHISEKGFTPEELLHNLYFSINDIQLDQESLTELLKMVDYLKEHQEVTLEIAGHTDNREARKQGASLSKKRANTVVEFLKEKGISENRMVSKGYGGKLPIASNDDEKDGREVNRRVEFYITNQ